VTVLALIRHMPTEWNADGRLQGRSNPPLSVDSTGNWLVSASLPGYRWLTSPLERCTATARRLGMAATVDPRLIEMSWGEWEGRTLAGLRASSSETLEELEAQGLDFRPPGGESPRDVQQRLKSLLAEVAASGEDTAAITHKGVIRAVLALATGWDMLNKPPHRLSWSGAHLFTLDAGGRPSVERLNIPLDRP
jgi:broad specificity phosphatase PhoE